MIMKDAKRVEAAHRRSGNNLIKTKTGTKIESTNKPTPMEIGFPMEIGNVQLQKLTKEERDRCMKKRNLTFI